MIFSLFTLFKNILYRSQKQKMNFTIWEKLMHNMKGKKKEKKERWCLLPWHISNHHPIPFFIFIGQDMIFIRVNSISTWAYFKELIKFECSLALVLQSYPYGATFWWYRVTLKAWVSFQKKEKRRKLEFCVLTKNGGGEHMGNSCYETIIAILCKKIQFSTNRNAFHVYLDK